uniref:hypothetical protein n=1 Tax=uncultured Altererythrobacter sp. TaxID=500840 RepID=UPI00260C65DD|nr:hypothetical protein [uncultured Altererythrobacter sp.]
MNYSPELVQFLGSLVAILAVAGLAWWMKLGGAPELSNEKEAQAAASEAMDGFESVETAVDANGRGAILRDRSGCLLLLKQHGNKFAGRLLTHSATGRIDKGKLVVDSGERRFGVVGLAIDHAQSWADRINEVRSARDA